MTTARRSRRLTMIGLAAVMALAMSACGDSGSPSGHSSGAKGVAGSNLGIGLMVPDTGAGNLKPLGDGLEAFVKYANAELGGFGGRPGKVDRCDYANDPQKAADCGRKAGDEAGNVVAVGSGRFGDVLLDAVSKAATPLPYVCPAQNRPLEGTSGNSFCLYAGSPMGYYAALTYMKSKGFNKGYQMVVDSDAGHGTAAAVHGFAKSLGMNVQQSFFPASQSDFLPVAQAALSAKPDFVLFGAGVPTELSLAQAFVTLGSTTPMGTWSSLLPQSSLDQLKAAKFPIVFDALTPDVLSSTAAEAVLYRDWMKKSGSPDTDLGDLSLQGWLAGRVIQAATADLTKAGTEITRASLLKALRTGTYDVALLPAPVGLSNAPKTTPGYTSVGNASVKVAIFQNGSKTVTDQVATLP